MSVRALSGDFAFYGLLDLVQRSIGLVMVPLYTRVLSQHEYGDLDILMIAISIFAVLVDLQFVSAFARLYFEYRNRGEGKAFVATVLTIRFLAGVAVASGLMVAGVSGLMEWSIAPPFRAHVGAWALVALTVPLSLTYDILLLQVRMLRWKRAFAVGALTSVVVSGCCSTVLVVWFHWGVTGVLTGLAAGKLAGTVALAWSVRHEAAIGIDRAILRPLFTYSLPLVPGWWLSFSSAYIGRFFVYGIHGPEQNAMLAIATKITTVVALFSISFRTAWQPIAMSYIGDAAGERFYVRSMRLFMAGSFGTTLCLAAFLHPVLLLLVPREYLVVELLFPVFAVGQLLSECESNFQLGSLIAKRTHWISIGAAAYLIVNCAVLVTMTDSLGVLAAGLGLAAASLARALITYASAQMNWRISYDLRSMAWYGGGCVAFLVLGQGHWMGVLPGVVARAGMLALGTVLPILILDPEERRAAWSMVTRWTSGGFSTAA